ncbi:MAG: alanine--tRNA ligase [Deltaproteobacteria bacterium]|nr:MAG: alanine--tRNA ligase [Deltaproteobacteria bacterium]
MGLERMAAVTQGVTSNYETDLFRPIMTEIEKLSGYSPGKSPQSDLSIKVVADHSRAAAFLIGDGVLPSNEGRGYVLRRIIRRAVRYGRTLGLKKPFLYQTAGKVARVMETAYPELLDAEAYIKNIIKNEEERFFTTLDTGLRVLEDALEGLQASGASEVPGNLICRMYDTYGFPVDIIHDIVRDERMSLDMTGFHEAMEQQRLRSRSAWAGKAGYDAGQPYNRLSARGIKTRFLGYDQTSAQARVLLLVRNGTVVERATEGDSIELVSDSTPFYAEAGGQVGDQGRITGADFDMEIYDTVRTPNDIIIHKGTVSRGSISTGETINLMVDRERRLSTARNHTATHLLHAVLREILGKHVKQAGSLVRPDRLRFDFTHFSALDTDTLCKIENRVNEKIIQNTPVHIEEMAADDAFKTGATALFEEKYGERVRVVTIGDFSKELCGGTHTERTGNIGLFKIVGEGSVGAGVRRIEALTGKAAVAYTQNTSNLLQSVAETLNVKAEEVADRVRKIVSEHRKIEKELSVLKARAWSEASDRLLSEIRTVNGISVLAREVPVETPAALRDLADHLKAKMKSGIVVLGSRASGKVMLVAVVTNDHIKRYHAGKIVKQLAPIVGGGGGGRPDMAQAGGTNCEKLPEALAAVYDIVSTMPT